MTCRSQNPFCLWLFGTEGRHSDMPAGFVRALQEPGPWLVSARQRRVHVITELVSMVLIGPFSLYLAASPRLRPWERVVLGLAGAGAIVVDGWLLHRHVMGETNDRERAGEIPG